MKNEPGRRPGRIAGINISGKKGTAKLPVDCAELRENFGVVGDAHAAAGSARQVSVLCMASVEKMKRQLGDKIKPGVFGENLNLEGIDMNALAVGARISFAKGALLEVSSIGKECHSGCEIFKACGKCIMPSEGIFCRVVKGGALKKGESFSVI